MDLDEKRAFEAKGEPVRKAREERDLWRGRPVEEVVAFRLQAELNATCCGGCGRPLKPTSRNGCLTSPNSRGSDIRYA
jgi:hypothetical protein